MLVQSETWEEQRGAVRTAGRAPAPTGAAPVPERPGEEQWSPRVQLRAGPVAQGFDPRGRRRAGGPVPFGALANYKWKSQRKGFSSCTEKYKGTLSNSSSCVNKREVEQPRGRRDLGRSAGPLGPPALQQEPGDTRGQHRRQRCPMDTSAKFPLPAKVRGYKAGSLQWE